MNRHIGNSARAAALGLVLAAALAGCSATTSSSSEDATISRADVAVGAPAGGGDVAATAPDASVGEAMPPSELAPAERSATELTTTQATATTHQIVRTAYVAMQADDVPKTAFDIRGLVAKSNGTVSNEQTQATGDSTSSMITALIPAASLDAFIADVSKLGSVDSMTVTADDVTSTVVDLDARIKALQTSIDRMTQLLANAKQIDDLLAIETQLSTRQADLDALTAQRRYLADQVAMSTVTMTVSPTATLERVDAPGFLSGLQNGWTAFVSMITVGVTALGFLLPFLLIGLLVVVPLTFFGVRHARRARRLAVEYADANATPLDDRAPSSSPT